MRVRADVRGEAVRVGQAQQPGSTVQSHSRGPDFRGAGRDGKFRGPVYRKNADGRDHGVEEQAWRLVPTKLPELLGRLLREGLPVIEKPPEINPLGGRPPASVFGLLYQSIIRVAWRNNLRASEGLMASPDHRQHNPYGGVSRSAISEFLADPTTTEILEKLLALTT